MSRLQDAVSEYLQLRRALGFKLQRAGMLLPRFVAFLQAEGLDFVTREAAVRWATKSSQTSAYWGARRLALVRPFARYLHGLDPRNEIPAADLLPYKQRRHEPYIYSDEDVEALLRATQELRSTLRASTYRTLLGLLAVSGMRVGEAIALDVDDIDWAAGALTVRHAKFGKERLVPLHETTVRALHDYAEQRDRKWVRPKASSFFVSVRGRRLIYNNVHRTFLELLQRSGLAAHAAPCRPRIHDLRHSFAVKTIVGWYRAGVDVEPRMPRLSTYLGHVCPSNTYWYLSATPELLGHASARLERHWGERA